MLHAEDFTYTFNLDNHSPYVKEAVILTLDLTQTNHDVVMLFDFSIVPSDNYVFQRLDIKEIDSYHNAKIHYVYLLYPIKSGELNISFELTQKVTSDESVAYSFSGDRDNVKTLVTVDTLVQLKPLQLKVKPLPPHTQIVGDFTLEHSIPRHKGKAYEPLPFQVTIEGKGYPPVLENILSQEGNFTRFTDKALVKSTASKQGTQSKVTYPMALSHSQSFTLPALHIKAFNPKTNKAYMLHVPAQDFNITQVPKDVLIDSIDSPKPWEEDWSWLRTFMGYLLVFVLGYISALSWKWSKKTIDKDVNPLLEKIQKIQNTKALLQLLMASKNEEFSIYIEKLEEGIYAEKTLNLKQLKKEILESIQ